MGKLTSEQKRLYRLAWLARPGNAERQKETKAVTDARHRQTEKYKARHRADSAKYRERHPEKVAALNERMRDRRKTWRLTEKGKASSRASVIRRRAKMLNGNSPNTFTAKDWLELVKKSPKCYWCKKPFNKSRRPTHDHVIPLWLGGENTIQNSVCACASCNHKRKRPIDPITGQGVLL